MTVKIENEHLSAQIKSFGAELGSIKDRKTLREYLWQGDSNIWSGQSPVLFPVIGRLLEDSYMLDNKKYFLAKHGFARKSEFTLTDKGEDFAVFTLRENEDTLKCYPFRFELNIKFQLTGKSIKVTHTVKNTGDKTMYFSLGAHPAFNIEVGDKIIFDKKENLCTMRIDENAIIASWDEKILDNSEELTVTEDIFKNDAVILEGFSSESLTLRKKNGEKILCFDLGGAPYLGIWAKPGAPYVCIEPWWGVNDDYDRKDDISKKKGIQKLESKKEFTSCWSAEF